MIIAVVNSKGGVGKTTLAVHLAVWLREQGLRVTLADCDTQRSSSQWVNEITALTQVTIDATAGTTAAPPAVARAISDADPADIHAVHFDNADAILKHLPLLAQDTDIVVADGPGSNSEISRALLFRADMAIVPCKASMLEVRALDAATEVLRVVQDVRKGMPRAIAVLSMVGKQYRLTQDMRDAAGTLGLPLASTPLVLRQSYADAPGQGTVVWNMGARAVDAAREVDLLFRELLPEISAKQSKKNARVRAPRTA